METSQPICTANQLTGFYMMATLGFNGLNQMSTKIHQLRSSTALFPVKRKYLYIFLVKWKDHHFYSNKNLIPSDQSENYMQLKIDTQKILKTRRLKQKKRKTSNGKQNSRCVKIRGKRKNRKEEGKSGGKSILKSKSPSKDKPCIRKSNQSLSIMHTRMIVYMQSFHICSSFLY